LNGARLAPEPCDPPSRFPLTDQCPISGIHPSLYHPIRDTLYPPWLDFAPSSQAFADPLPLKGFRATSFSPAPVSWSFFAAMFTQQSSRSEVLTEFSPFVLANCQSCGSQTMDVLGPPLASTIIRPVKRSGLRVNLPMLWSPSFKRSLLSATIEKIGYSFSPLPFRSS